MLKVGLLDNGCLLGFYSNKKEVDIYLFFIVFRFKLSRKNNEL